MEWLLKIVEGPMRGAEIALIPGFRVKVGSSDACDIVLADSSLAEQAFELDVTEETVTLIPPDGEARVLPVLTVFRFGSSAFAYGPSGDVWGELKELPNVEAKPEEAASEGEANGEATFQGLQEEDGSSSSSEATGKSLPHSSTPHSSTPHPSAPRSSHRGLIACCCALVVLALLGALTWLCWPWISANAPAVWKWARDLVVTPPPPPPPPPPSLAEIARMHGLAVGTRNGRPLIAGNVRLRTERLAIRALALASDPMTDFDLTDDESLRASSTELLFVVTEGDLYAVSASNRVVTIAGYAPDQVHLETSVRALNADVPGISRLVTKDVQIGGSRPKRVGRFGFRRDQLQSTAKGGGGSRSVSESSRYSPGKTGSITPLPPARSYAIAGILTKPYPCLVMRNGARLTEGAQVEGCVVEKIEVDRLILKEGANRFEWRP